MKKISVLFFSITTILMLCVIANGTIKTDIFSLITPNQSILQHQETIQIAQQRITKKLAILSTDPTLLSAMNPTLFQELFVQRDFDFTILNQLKIASLNPSVYADILQNPAHFFQQSAEQFLNPFLLRLDSKDLLNLSSYSSFLKQNQFTLDLESKILFTTFNGVKYYLANGVLKDNYDSTMLLNEIARVKQIADSTQHIFLAVGSEVFASKSKAQGNHEGIILGIISIILITLLMYFAFHSWHILKLLFIVFYSFLSGISVAFLVFGEIHIISLIISISLIGLVLDFAMHWLGDMSNQTIQPKDIVKFIKIFLVGLVITSGGYGFFLLSEMDFLRQVAVISIFGLIGAFLITTCLLPFLLQGIAFQPKPILQKLISTLMAGVKKLRIHQKAFILILCVFTLCTFVFLLPKQNFTDDIKHYSTIPESLLQEMYQFSNITQNQNFSDFAIIKSNNLIDTERSITHALLKENLIQDYEGISKFFLSTHEQDILKDTLQKHRDSFIGSFKAFGIKEEILLRSIQSLTQQESLDLNAIRSLLQYLPSNPLDTFLIQENTSILFFKNPIINARFHTILENNNAYFIQQSAEVSKYFTEAKENAIVLKFYAFAFAWIVLWLLFGFRRALPMVAIIIFSSLLSIAILLVLGVELNIFSIFGLILASSVGVDYVIFANNAIVPTFKRFFGILLANLTSIISFSLLGFSQTYAIFSFGISVSLCMFLCAFFALLFIAK